ncbi:hypothetical protein HMPREF0305_10453 [Corynebacterium pseudogenitalium ATCC 33035]|uniref:DUF4439 domain-containing protein n=1 Tax=Corynebacterium pseudogenitalium ATCC 33035 TaxID=525264 RepID=E2S1Q1_9CORY|nr:hypothetical protein HMPREF0305_10453 [Corynebacterium pseudogenitalium ATCC 33035]
MAGCQAVDSVVDYFGPRPESRLLALADAAATDALSLSGVDDHAAGLRSSQADALYAEITRLCGTDDAGNPPRSCEVERPTEANHAADSGEIMENAASATTEAADEVTVESRTLVTEQAIALNAWLPSDAPDIPELSQPEQKSAADLLSWEYEQVFGLDFARAYVGPEHEDKVDHRLAVHHRRIDALQDALARYGNIPQPESAYTSGEQELPHDSASALAFIDGLAEHDGRKWSAAATGAAQEESPDQEWVTWLIGIAAESHGMH